MGEGDSERESDRIRSYNMIFNTLNLTAEKARFYLAKFDWLLLTNTLNTKNEEFVENLENARKIFAQMKFFGLEIKSVFYIGEFYIRRQK